MLTWETNLQELGMTFQIPIVSMQQVDLDRKPHQMQAGRTNKIRLRVWNKQPLLGLGHNVIHSVMTPLSPHPELSILSCDLMQWKLKWVIWFIWFFPREPIRVLKMVNNILDSQSKATELNSFLPNEWDNTYNKVPTFMGTC